MQRVMMAVEVNRLHNQEGGSRTLWGSTIAGQTLTQVMAGVFLVGPSTVT